jgi:hypothetical protein
MTLTSYQKITTKYNIQAQEMLSTGGFLAVNPDISDFPFLQLDTIEYLEVSV